MDTEQSKNRLEQAKEALQHGDLINGLAQLTQAIVEDPALAEARVLRAEILLKMGNVKGAQEDCTWLMEHMGDLTGNFTAEGVEHRAKKIFSSLNPHGL